MYCVLKGRLGSVYAASDTLGNVVWEMCYYAFGETRLSTGNMFTDRLYTGQRQIVELGIYHYNARFYSPTLGRFLSADTLMSGFANPQNLNAVRILNGLWKKFEMKCGGFLGITC